MIDSATATSHPVPLRLGSPLWVPVCSSVRAGFPSPADDFLHKHIDIGAELIRHPQATFLLRIAGRSMETFGIFDGDTVVVDKAITPVHGHIVIAVVDGEFTCKQLYSKAGVTKLVAGNPEFEELTFTDGQTLEVWGVVTSCIKQFAV
ncbi:translesion error-prone DNA polymerase V autoproteolytic subunit [Lampropedia puyangensis]|uniref:Translesion error-prone DNA polymerase V autoproteolytic subunit n=2 Tax=Lampropedia puyangensis TaxID=1330072 RepID=A0A4S8EPD5_9BURK|nr:translesion error-prone DNA polymerase V autoproteolytic subunit [Lampropedia puyangensis]THT95970.1 translesion error-prone DNA polymerase V autoproteolytic subunit [Lampropedia puyangensis]